MRILGQPCEFYLRWSSARRRRRSPCPAELTGRCGHITHEEVEAEAEAEEEEEKGKEEEEEEGKVEDDFVRLFPLLQWWGT